MGYRLSLDLDAHDFALGLPPRDRATVFKALQRLRDAPFTPGDTTVRDSVGRDRQIKQISEFVIEYWTDHAVKTVMVTEISRV